MARFIGDQQKVVGIHESGTYANNAAGADGLAGSTFWIGQVTEHKIDDNLNYSRGKYMGTGKRTYDTLDDGPEDVTGTLSYHPHDARLLFFAIGSIIDVSGATATTCTHSVSEVQSDVWQNPFVSGTNSHPAPLSFTLEDSKQSPGTGRNLIRTVKGCVINNLNLTLTQGEKETIDIDYIAEKCYPSSGTTTVLVNSGTQALKPYVWNNALLTIAGSPLDTAKEITLKIDKKLNAPHYVNGSKTIGVPYERERGYTLGVTMDLDGQDAMWLYDEKYKGGSEFNATLDKNADITAVGSKHTVLYMSGCRILNMDNPSNADADTTETKIDIEVKNITGSAWDRTHKYCPW